MPQLYFLVSRFGRRGDHWAQQSSRSSRTAVWVSPTSAMQFYSTVCGYSSRVLMEARAKALDEHHCSTSPFNSLSNSWHVAKVSLRQDRAESIAWQILRSRDVYLIHWPWSSSEIFSELLLSAFTIFKAWNSSTLPIQIRTDSLIRKS